MKTIKTILSVLAVMALVASCSKNDVTVNPTCRTYNVSYAYKTTVTYVGCNGIFYTTTYNPGEYTIEAEALTSQYSYSNIVGVENNTNFDFKFKDGMNDVTVKPSTDFNVIGSNEFVITFNDDVVKGVQASLIVEGELKQVYNLTSSPAKFFANIPKGATVKVVLESPTPSN